MTMESSHNINNNHNQINESSLLITETPSSSSLETCGCFEALGMGDSITTLFRNHAKQRGGNVIVPNVTSPSSRKDDGEEDDNGTNNDDGGTIVVPASLPPDSHNLSRRRSDPRAHFTSSHFQKQEIDVLLRLYRELSGRCRDGTIVLLRGAAADVGMDVGADVDGQFSIDHVEKDKEEKEKDNEEKEKEEKRGGNEQCQMTFLVGLASCGVIANTKHDSNHHDNKDNNNDDDDDDEEEDLQQTINRLLEQAKQSARYENRKSTFLRQVQFVEENILPPQFGTFLLEALGHSTCWDCDVASERRFLNVLSAWLGRRGDEEVILEIVFDLVSSSSSVRSDVDIHDSAANDYDSGDANHDGTRSQARQNYSSSGTNASTCNTTTKREIEGDETETKHMANAHQLVDWCYRLAVATYTLQQCLDKVSSIHHATTIGGNGHHDDDCIIDPRPLASTNAMATSLLNAATEVEQKRVLMERQIQNMKLDEANNYNLDSSISTFNASPTNPTPSSSPSSKEHGLVSKSVFKYWHKKYFPSMASSLSCFMNHIIFPCLDEEEDNDNKSGHKLNKILKSSATTRTQTGMRMENSQYDRKQKIKNLFPLLDKSRDSDFFTSPISSSLYALACIFRTNSGSTTWPLLFSTSYDGRSFNRLEHGINGYQGPTLLIIRVSTTTTNSNNNNNNTIHSGSASNTAVFGAYASSPWKKKNTKSTTDEFFFGNRNCFLFQLHPHIQIMQTTNNPRGGRYQYYHPDPPKGSKPCARGLGLGGSTTRPRLFVCHSLDKCRANSSDLSFEAGELVPSDVSLAVASSSSSSSPPLLLQGRDALLDIESLEVWGLGDDDAMSARGKHRDVVDSHLRQARTVDKAAFLGDFRSGLIESKMFDFRQQMRDRDGGCILDCDDDDGDAKGRWQIGGGLKQIGPRSG